MAKAIIVDDSKFMRRIIRETLEKGGHEIVAEADNGFDGVESYRMHIPDFITMDITMGGKDGINAVKEIIQINKNAKVFIISALNEKTIRLNDDNVQPTAFITKPFSKEKLLETIEKSL